jgi:olfactory receptor
MICGGLENSLLAIMAYDRYMAICHLLRYTVILTPFLCILMVVISLLVSILNGLLHSLMLLQLSFFTDLEIPYFFCELDQIIRFACSDTFINNILLYSVAGLFACIPLSEIIFSYTQVLMSILRIPSVVEGIKHFPPVVLTYQWCPYSMKQPLECT